MEKQLVMDRNTQRANKSKTRSTQPIIVEISPIVSPISKLKHKSATAPFKYRIEDFYDDQIISQNSVSSNSKATHSTSFSYTRNLQHAKIMSMNDGSITFDYPEQSSCGDNYSHYKAFADNDDVKFVEGNSINHSFIPEKV